MSPCHLGHSALNWCSTSLLLALFPSLFLEACPCWNSSARSSWHRHVNSHWNLQFSTFSSLQTRRSDLSEGRRDKSFACFNGWWVKTVWAAWLRMPACVRVCLCICEPERQSGHAGMKFGIRTVCRQAYPLFICPSVPPSSSLPASFSCAGPPLLVFRLLRWSCCCKWWRQRGRGCVRHDVGDVVGQ